MFCICHRVGCCKRTLAVVVLVVPVLVLVVAVVVLVVQAEFHTCLPSIHIVVAYNFAAS